MMRKIGLGSCLWLLIVNVSFESASNDLSSNAQKGLIADKASEKNIINKQVIPASKLIIVTLDGLRWQEVFTGADTLLLKDSEVVSNTQTLENKFGAKDAVQRALKLMPFFHRVLKKQGVLIGNPIDNQSVKLTNDYYFSYPGYIEIYTGKVDPKIVSNAKVKTDTPNILELLQNKHQYPNKVAFFGSWDVFPYIMRRGEHEVIINTGFESLAPNLAGLTQKADIEHLQQLNMIFNNTPSPWETVRLDAFTHAYAMTYLRNVKPQVMAISYGDTDDFAHDGEYDQYLHAAHRTDKMIAELWNYIQHDPYYKNQTHLLITSDHGRGSSKADWQHHASEKAVQGYMKGLSKFPKGIIGSDQVWIAGIGPNIKSAPQGRFDDVKLTQFAPTALVLLGECQLATNLAQPISEILETNPCD